MGTWSFFPPFLSPGTERAVISGCSMLEGPSARRSGKRGNPGFGLFLRGVACRGSCSVGASKAAVSGYQQVPVINGWLHMMEQIDHCITRHNLLISTKRAIHYRAHHRDTVIPADNVSAALAWASYHPNMPLSCKKW